MSQGTAADGGESVPAEHGTPANAAWAKAAIPLSPQDTFTFLADIERLFRLNPHLDISGWHEAPGAARRHGGVLALCVLLQELLDVVREGVARRGVVEPVVALHAGPQFGHDQAVDHRSVAGPGYFVGKRFGKCRALGAMMAQQQDRGRLHPVTCR